MSEHNPLGSSLCVHSVVVAEKYRRKGVARSALRAFISAVNGSIERVLLIAHSNLVQLYADVGFRLVGVSGVHHGAEPWFEMKLEIGASQTFMTVDSFSSAPFRGNPAAVVFSHGAEAWMQGVAQEFNLAETAFVSQRPDGDFELRWFTPSCEVDLCGHATLAAAHALLSTHRAVSPVQFHTRSGPLLVSQQGTWLCMDFPAEAVIPCEIETAAVSASIGVAVQFVGRTRFDILCEVLPTDFRNLRVDLASVAALGCRGLIVTSASSSQSAAPSDGLLLSDPTEPVDFLSRFFGPAVGIPEDPVTGSAHCGLAPYWMGKLGKAELTGWQASKRGGLLKLEVKGQRVLISGRALSVMEGTLRLRA